MSNTRDLLDTVAGEFSGLDNDVKDQAINFASQRISAEAFGRLYQQAVVYLAAHILKSGMAGQAGDEKELAGPVTSITTGDLSIGSAGTASFTGSDEPLSSTSYGRQYLEIKNKLPAGPLLG